MRLRLASLLLLSAIAILTTACKNEIDKTQFKTAINNSFTGRHECIWPETVKMPAEADPSKDERTRDFDALTDAGLLARAPEEKKRFLEGNDVELGEKQGGHFTPARSSTPKQMAATKNAAGRIFFMTSALPLWHV